MTHVLHRATRLLQTSKKRRQTSRKLDAVLRDPHLAKDVGLPYRSHSPRKSELW